MLPSALVHGKSGAEGDVSTIRDSINQDSDARTASIHSITELASCGKWQLMTLACEVAKVGARSAAS
jgi:hypothetical protein